MVKDGGVAEDLGVQVGWQILSLDGISFTQCPVLLDQKARSGEPYQVTLLRPSTPVAAEAAAEDNWHRIPVRSENDEIIAFLNMWVQPFSTSVGCDYATICAGGKPDIPHAMVTHHWANKFYHLMAAVFADALDRKEFEEIANMLTDKDFDRLRQLLDEKNALQRRYWICAFCVNQHSGICAPSTYGGFRPGCNCYTRKYLDGAGSEMNKFDHMMRYLKRQVRSRRDLQRARAPAAERGKGEATRGAKHKAAQAVCNLFQLNNDDSKKRWVYKCEFDSPFYQVVAVDCTIEIVTRVWCVSELYEAYRSRLPQKMKIFSYESLQDNQEKVKTIDVEKSEASLARDKELVLSKLDNISAFNQKVANMLCQQVDEMLSAAHAQGLVDGAFAGVQEVVFQNLNVSK